MASLLFLSDEAYNGLVQQARETLFIRTETRPRGLSKFMTRLLESNPLPDLWIDNRPDYLQAILEEELEGGYFPTWDKGDRRFPRNLGVTPVVLIKSALLARTLGVIKSNAPKQRGRGDTLTQQALSSEFWEAVGLSWLKPTHLPQGFFRSKLRVQPEELIW